MTLNHFFLPLHQKQWQSVKIVDLPYFSRVNATTAVTCYATAIYLIFVGVRGFEPPTSSSRTTHANRTALHPEVGVGVGVGVGVSVSVSVDLCVKQYFRDIVGQK